MDVSPDACEQVHNTLIVLPPAVVSTCCCFSLWGHRQTRRRCAGGSALWNVASLVGQVCSASLCQCERLAHRSLLALFFMRREQQASRKQWPVRPVMEPVKKRVFKSNFVLHHIGFGSQSSRQTFTCSWYAKFSKTWTRILSVGRGNVMQVSTAPYRTVETWMKITVCMVQIIYYQKLDLNLRW